MTVAPGSGHVVWLPLPESAVGAFAARYVAEPEAAETRLGGQIPIHDKIISEATQ